MSLFLINGGGGGGGGGRPQALFIMLLLIGSVLKPSHGLKCFSCEGYFCQHLYGEHVKECEPSVTACFKSGHGRSLITGCASTHLMSYFRNKATKGKHNSCFLCSGSDPVPNFQKWCYGFGDSLSRLSTAWLREFSLDAATCLCYDDLCNDGPTSLKIVIGNWMGGRCQRRTFKKFIAEEILDAKMIKLGPDYYSDHYDMKLRCGWTPPRKKKGPKASLESSLMTAIIIGCIISIIFLQCVEHF